MKLPETGIEPVRVLPRRILSPVRLPIPPLGQILKSCVVFSRSINIPNETNFVNNFFQFFQKSFPARKKNRENKSYSAVGAVIKGFVTSFAFGVKLPLRKDCAKPPSPMV